MTRLVSLLALCFLVGGPVWAFETEAPFDDPALEARYRSLIREVRCPMCLNESIAESNAPVAADLRRAIRRLIAEGASDDDVRTFLSSRYGESILYRPRLSAATWPLWAGPFVFMGIGGLVFWRILKTRRNQPIDEDPAT